VRGRAARAADGRFPGGLTMCGIAGWIAKRDENLNERVLGDMLESMAHRGPDGEGIFVAGGADPGQAVFLGHRRLAIIAPEGARQPMTDADAGLALSFNGEIYNFRELRQQLSALGYRFTLDSDTEVLLRAYQHWGTDVARRLRGMFAFAVWDERNKRLFLARDRFGEKPLFLYRDGRGLFFASEIKALLRVPGVGPEVDLGAVWDYLAYRYVPGPRTLFSGIVKLMPGTCAIWENGSMREVRYWSSPDRVAQQGPAQRHAVHDFLASLDDAVRVQMVSDVPFGAFLSGGLDSSTIVALMTRHCTKVNTFSVGFQESGFSELGYAREVADAFGTAHHELVVSSRDIIERLPRLIAFRDAPVSEPSDIAINMLAEEASRSVKMVLTGEGSDEILGGYPKHVAERFASGYRTIPHFVRSGLITPLARALPFRFSRVKTAVGNLGIEDWRERYVRWFGALDARERARLSVLSAGGAPADGHPPFDAAPGNSTLRRILYFDQTSWLPDNLLERGDRMTMAASIEARVPFLDHKLASCVSALPDRYRVRGLKTKWVLREAAKSLIPRSILNRPKVGFKVPVSLWFREGLRDFLMEHLGAGSSTTRAYYAPQVLDRILDEHLQGRHNHEKLLWSLLNLEIWHRQFARP